MTGPGLRTKFWAKVDLRSDDECWPWLGFRDREGYGRFYSRELTPPTSQAHRVAYELDVGPIPAGLTIDHLCRNPSCVNPLHLEPVTDRENILRGDTLAAKNAAKTRCVRGHEFTPENTYMRPGGKRRCRQCAREADRRRKSQHTEYMRHWRETRRV